MDKLVTLFGYLSSYVVPSRRNGGAQEDRGSNAKKTSRKSQANGESNDSRFKASLNSTDSGFNSTNGGLKGVSSGENNLNRPKASVFMETNLDTLRGEVREIQPQPPPTRCKIQRDEPLKRARHIDVFSGQNPSALPPVDTIQPSCANIKTAHNGILTASSAGTSSDGVCNTRTKGALPSVNNDREELLTKDTHPEKQGKNQDLRRSYGLPNIFSNVGKSFVETNQLSVFDRTSFRKKSTCVENVTPVEKTSMEEDCDPANGRKSRLKMPKAKRKSKKRKKGNVCEAATRSQVEQYGKEESRIAGEEGMKECDEAISCQAKQEGKGAQKMEAEGSTNNPKGERPRTALGKWMKRRSNSVAPAALYDSTTGATECVQIKERGSPMQTNKDLDAPEKQDSSPSRTTPDRNTLSCKTVLVRECSENVSVIIVKEATNEQTKFFTRKDARKKISNTKLTEQVQERFESATKAEREEEAGSYGGPAKEEEVPTGKVTPPYPVKRDLLKETVENVSLAALNDEPTVRLKITTKRKLNINRLDRTDDHLSAQRVSGSEGDSKSSSLKLKSVGKKDGVLESVQTPLDLGSGLPDPIDFSPGPSSKSCKTIYVKQRSESTCKKLVEEDPTMTQMNDEHDIKAFGVESLRRDTKKGVKDLSVLNDSENSVCTTTDLKQGAGSTELNSITGNPGSNVGNGELPILNDSKFQPQGPVGAAPSSATGNGMQSFSTSRKPSTLISESIVALHRDECPSTALPAIDKPKWNGGQSCLPAIKPEKKQKVEDFLEKQRRKQQQQEEDDFEGWEQDEPEEVKRILQRPVTAKIPNYPADWGPLPNERPPGRGGQGYCLGVLWKKPERSALSDSSCEGMSDKYFTALL